MCFWSVLRGLHTGHVRSCRFGTRHARAEPGRSSVGGRALAAPREVRPWRLPAPSIRRALNDIPRPPPPPLEILLEEVPDAPGAPSPRRRRTAKSPDDRRAPPPPQPVFCCARAPTRAPRSALAPRGSALSDGRRRPARPRRRPPRQRSRRLVDGGPRARCARPRAATHTQC